MLLSGHSTRVLVCALAALTSLALSAEAQSSFSQRSYASLPGEPLTGDFNHDGKPDLLSVAGDFFLLLNNGSGTFGARQVSDQPGSQYEVSTTDFNRDGRTDLVGCHDPDHLGAGPHDLAVWTGNGAGGFSQPQRTRLPGSCVDVATADFNNDGKLDIAAIWQSGTFEEPGNGLSVFMGNGTGGVSQTVRTDAIAAPSMNGACRFVSLVAGNYDRSGSPDLVISTDCPPDAIDHHTLVFAQGGGNGQFTFFTVEDGNYDFDLEKDDTNQDSRLDLIVYQTFTGPHASSGTKILFHENTRASGVPLFQPREVEGYSGNNDPNSSVNPGIAVDVNGDGLKDGVYGEAINTSFCCGPMAFYLSIKLRNADGTFGEPQRLPLASDAAVVSADFDRDGRPDIAATTSGSTEVFLNRTGSATCSANASLRTVKICAPATITGNTLQLRANTTSGGPVTGMKVYRGNAEVFYSPNDLLNKKLTLPTGTHTLTVRAWDGQGSFSSQMTVAAGGGTSTCTAPSTNRTINICSPANESTVANPVQVKAAITTSSQYHGAKIYIDGSAKYSTSSKQVQASFTLSSGRHRISVQAYDSQGAFTKTVYVNVP